jgi:hypothetical protein
LAKGAVAWEGPSVEAEAAMERVLATGEHSTGEHRTGEHRTGEHRTDTADLAAPLGPLAE